jgi:hypothetical protein
VVELVAHELRTVPQEIDGSLLSLPEIQKSFQELRDRKWLWGETPLFELETAKGGLSVHKGQVKSPFQSEFSREHMQEWLSQEQLERFFPDFSEQHRLSNLIL